MGSPQSLRQIFQFRSSRPVEAIGKQMFVFNPVFAAIFALIYGGLNGLWINFWRSYFVAGLISAFIFLVLYSARYLEISMRKALKKPERTPSRAWWFVLSLCAMPFGFFLATVKIAPVLGPALGLGEFTPNTGDYTSPIIIGSLIGFGFFAWGSFTDTRKSLNKSKEELKELQNQHLKAQLAALTAQMNPHLLFNALNTVASLVQSDPDKAEETIVTLSELYRGVLNSSKNMVHSLAKEIELCEAYLKIEKARFGERLQTQIFIDSSLDPTHILIPSLSLQPLVENAVKHGISKRASGGSVKISVCSVNRKIEMSVEDDGLGFHHKSEIQSAGTGTGLENSKSRFNLHFGEESTFDILTSEQGTKVLIVIPLHSKAGEA